MTSDESTRTGSITFRPAGTGLPYQFRCGKCNQPIPNLGRRKQMVRGLKVWVGKCCQPSKVSA